VVSARASPAACHASGEVSEMSHAVRGGRECLCGRRGCLEAYASGTFIGRRADERIAAGDLETRLVAPATAEQVARAADGDPLAQAIWTETVELLGQAVTDFVNIIEPDVVVLGGGVTRSGAQLLDPVRRIVADGAMEPAARAVRVELAALGDAVCVVGAGVLALDAG
jgi:glucokinase